jgi:hypothetical protein
MIILNLLPPCLLEAVHYSLLNPGSSSGCGETYLSSPYLTDRQPLVSFRIAARNPEQSPNPRQLPKTFVDWIKGL